MQLVSISLIAIIQPCSEHHRDRMSDTREGQKERFNCDGNIPSTDNGLESYNGKNTLRERMSVPHYLIYFRYDAFIVSPNPIDWNSLSDIFGKY